MIIPATLSELTGPVYGERRRSASSTPTSRGSTPANRSASGSSSAAACSASDGRPLRGQLVEIWQANAAGRYRHAVDPHDAPLDPNFTGAGPLPHRRRRAVPVHHGEARRVSVGEPSERVAAEPHPLLALRARVHRAARDADVLPGRPAVRARPDLQLDPRRGGARAADLQLRPRADRARLGARLPAGTSCSAAATATPLEEPHDD